MGLRRAHGRARELGRIASVEPSPIAELPKGVPSPTATPQPARTRSGRYVAGDPRTIAAASAAGRAKRDRSQLAHTLAVRSDDPEWQAYLRQAEGFRRAQVRLLASTVGGGRCGPAPAALVASAALALAGSRLSYQRGELMLGARLAGEVRLHLVGAHELCAREAEARPPSDLDYPWLTPAADDEPEEPEQ